VNAIAETQVDRIRTLAAELDTLGKTALEKASEAGRLLIECKARLQHGEWLPWLESNFSFTDRTARNWMRISEAHDAGKLENVSDLSEAYRVITDSKPDENDGRPETFAELSESGKERCRLWWDSCSAEVLARWAMDVPAETIAEHVGRSLDEVKRIIRPRFIHWESYGSDGIHIPARLYDDCRRSLAASWMAGACRVAPLYIDRDLRPSPATEKAKRRLEAKQEHYEEEFKATADCSPFQLFSMGLDTARNAKSEDESATGCFFYKIGETALNDARHACAIADYPKLGECKALLLHWHILDQGITPKEFDMLVTDPDAFREYVKTKEKGEAA
jgi:hypothetical protein